MRDSGAACGADVFKVGGGDSFARDGVGFSSDGRRTGEDDPTSDPAIGADGAGTETTGEDG